MQFYVKKVQNWKNVCIVRCEFLCGKYQCHQPRLLCLKKMYQAIRKYINGEIIRLRSKLLNLARTEEMSEGLIKISVSST